MIHRAIGGRGELFPNYKTRVILAVQVRRQGRPIPASLREPLSLETQKAIDDGKALSHVLLIASTPRTQPSKIPGEKKPKPERAVEKSTPLKLW